ncbi:MAG: DUF2436 domain-containing protein [Clostridia bacterium]|nr:DUF2436 domain-containing protein [Clostridia bacterium]
MKKFLALLISVALVLALVAIPAAAEGEVTFTVATVNDVHPGDTVEVPLTVTNTTGVGAHTLVAHVLFDANYLTINTVTNGPLLGGLVPIIDWTTLEGDVAIGFMAPTGDGMTEDGLLLTMEFTVNDNCSLDQVLTMRVDECFNYPLNGSATALDTVGVDGAINMADDVVPVTPAPTQEPTTPPTQEPTTPPTQEPTTPPAGGNATIILNVPSDVWEDGTGYQMLLDADANTYGTIIPTTGGLTSSGNASAATYAEFEYKIPENADGALTTSNIIVTGQGSVVIPAGTYDWCITNPTPGDRVWIASSNGNIPGRYDDFEFEANKTYTFTVTRGGQNDRVDLEITDGSTEPTEPPAPTDVPQPTEPPAPVEGLVAGFYFEDEAEVNQWTFIGTNDTNWVWSVNNPGGYDYTEFAHEGGRFIMSYSFVDYVGPYQADNWAISPAVTLPDGDASVSFYANQANASYPETISVYVGLTPNTADMMLLQANVSPTTGYDDEWTRYELDLSDYAGETIYLAFYDNCYDCYEIWIDQVEFWGEGEPVVTPEPTEVPQPTDPGYDAGSATITMGSEYEVPGGAQIVLPLSIEGEYQAHTLNLAVNYDPAVLEVVDVELVNLPEDTYQIVDYETIPGVIAIGLVMAGEELDYSGVIANITFNVADPFTEETPVEVEVKEFNFVPEATEYPVEYTVVNGVVTPVETEPTEPVVTEPPVTEGAVFTMGSEYEVPGGSVITLPFTISGEYEAHTLNAALVYDPEVLTVLDVQPGEMLATRDVPPVVIIDYETIPGTIAIGVIMPEQALTGEGTLVNVTFKVCDDFTEATPIEVVINEFGYLPIGETVEEPIEFTTVDGIVTPVGEPGPTDEPVEPTDEPVEPTDEPVEPTDEPVEPTDEPGPNPPTPPVTGAASLVGLGVMAILAGAGVVIFRRKED